MPSFFACTKEATLYCDTHGGKSLSLVYTSAPNGSQTARKPNAGMCERDYKPVLRHPQTEICWFFAQTQRELDVPGILSMHRVSFARLRFAEN